MNPQIRPSDITMRGCRKRLHTLMSFTYNGATIMFTGITFRSPFLTSAGPTFITHLGPDIL